MSGLTPRTLEQIFKIYVKFHDFSMVEQRFVQPSDIKTFKIDILGHSTL